MGEKPLTLDDLLPAPFPFFPIPRLLVERFFRYERVEEVHEVYVPEEIPEEGWEYV